MKIKLLFTIIFDLALLFCRAQLGADFSFEFQAYPTGLIPGFRLEKTFGQRSAAHVRLGYNWIRHGNAGKHDLEWGDGCGFTLGYKRYFREGFEKFSLGIRNDLWFNEMEWKDQIGTTGFANGSTKIIVVQPTLEASWLFRFGSDWFITPSLAFGYEVNVKTVGSPTGEGAILLAGVLMGKRF
jgi:hypothetical protein